MTSTLAAEKVRAREQWGRDPCGAEYEREHELGTRKFFDSVERHRYTQYAPWMPRVMGFDQFRGARLLEIGCGMGTDLLQFARGGAGCVGQFRCGVFQRRVAPHAGYHGRDSRGASGAAPGWRK